MTEPVTLADIKVHLELGSATEYDTYLAGMLIAARRGVELKTGRTIVGDVPDLTDADLEMAKHAIRLAVGSWFQNREAEGDGKAVELPISITWLLDPLKKWDDGADQ